LNVISNRLKLLRKEKDVMQKDVANFLDISSSAYGFYEQGKRTPTSDIIVKLAKYFDVSTDYLLGKTDNRNIETKTNNELNIGTKKESDVNEVFNKCFEGENVFLCGEPLTNEDRILLEQSIKSTIELAKKMMNKKTK